MEFWMWSWLLTIVGCTGFWVTKRSGVGWAINIGSQVLWIAYGLVTAQYGFIASALVYGVVFTRNLVGWLRSRDFGMEGMLIEQLVIDPVQGSRRAEGTGYHPRVGQRFRYLGVEMVINEVLWCPDVVAPRSRWRAIDRRSQELLLKHS